MNQEEKTERIKHIISLYRQTIDHKYQYDVLKKDFDMPSEITPEIIEQIKSFFLHQVYPEYAQRKKLEEAFKSLSNFISKPSRIWGLLGNMTSAVFKFGKHFPVAVKAGVATLDSFVNAKEFEEKLLQASIDGRFKHPMRIDQLEQCIVSIPKQDVMKFITDIEAIFKAITNTKLVSITIDVVENVLSKMKNNPDKYTKIEIEGIRLGEDILRKGYNIFKDLDEKTKRKIVEIIVQNETTYMDKLYKNT